MSPAFSPYFSRRRPQGFTLVEMLVSLVISLILIGLIASMILSSATVTATIHSRLSAYHDANLALDYLAQDINSIVPPDLTPQSTLSIVPDGVVTPNNDLPSSMWIMLISRPASAQQTAGVYQYQGAASTISYRVVYQDPITPGGLSNNQPNTNTFALYRSVVTPPTSVGFFNKADLFNDFWNSYWSGYAGSGVPLNDFLLENVIGIQVTLNYSYLETPTDPTTTTLGSATIPVASTSGPNSDSGVIWTSSGFVSAAITPPAANGANTPISIDVTLTMLRSHGALLYQQGDKKLNQLNGTDPKYPTDTITISRNFPIKANPVD